MARTHQMTFSLSDANWVVIRDQATSLGQSREQVLSRIVMEAIDRERRRAVSEAIEREREAATAAASQGAA